jgi:hypothetical protein
MIRAFRCYRNVWACRGRDPFSGVIRTVYGEGIKTLDGVKMARSCTLTRHIWFRLALLMPLEPSHSLVVRRSNPCEMSRKLFASDFRSGNVYFGLITITESVCPFPLSSVAELVGSFSPTPSIRNL